MQRPSRFTDTYRKLRLARYAVVAASTAAFGGLALMTRASHAGTNAGSGASAPAAAAVSRGSVSDDGSSDDQSQSFGYGSSSLAPSGGSGALVQSGGS